MPVVDYHATREALSEADARSGVLTFLEGEQRGRKPSGRYQEQSCREHTEPKVGMGATVFNAGGASTPTTVVDIRLGGLGQMVEITLRRDQAVQHYPGIGYITDANGELFTLHLVNGNWVGSSAVFGANHRVVFGVRASARLERVAGFIAWVRGLHERTKYFHLGTCACGQPSWQQPCPWCGFYPDYGRPKEAQRETDRAKECADAARVRLDTMGGASGFFLAYCRGFKGVVAYKTDADFRTWADNLRTRRWDPRFNDVTIADIRAYAALPQV
jgi:hypothetical protein